MAEWEERQLVVRVALTWERTPFEYNACVKGVGVDCGRYPAAVFNEAGIKDIDIRHLPKLPPMWFMHRRSGGYLAQLEKYAKRYELPHGQFPKPADIIVARYGFDWAHGAIVISWPTVIGAAHGGVVTVWKDVNTSPQYMGRELAYLDPWGKK